MAIRNQHGEKLTTKRLISLTPESRVAARLGLTGVLCASLRRDHLKPQVDYVVERKRVMITDAGYVALRGLLSCPESPDEEKALVSHRVREPEPISLVITSLSRRRILTSSRR